MRGLILRWILSILSLWLVSAVLKGIEVSGFWALLFASIVLGIFNALIRPVLLLLTLPLNLLTLGLFTFVVNGFLIWLTGRVVEGFAVHGFLTAVVAAILLAVFNGMINWLVRG